MFKNPFSFKGRIRRTEYGISIIIFVVVAYSFDFLLEAGGKIEFLGLVYIPLMWFILAQGAKRCHDTSDTGGYQLIPFHIFWLLFVDGEPGNNKYGPNPKGVSIDEWCLKNTQRENINDPKIEKKCNKGWCLIIPIYGLWMMNVKRTPGSKKGYQLNLKKTDNI